MPTYKNETNSKIQLDGLSYVEKGETLETTRVIKHPDLTKISEDPYFPLALNYHNISFASAEQKEVLGLLDSKVLRVSTNIGITIAANTSENPYAYPLDGGESIDIFHYSSIDSLILTSNAAGEARVIELKD